MIRLLAAFVCVLFLQSCVAERQQSLYTALGESAGIAQIVDFFILEIAADERVFVFFADSNVDRFREKITEHFCMIADGPCVYTGDSMERVHGGMAINTADFNAVVEDLILAMEKSGVPVGTQNRLLARLVPLREEIINL